MFSSYFYIGFEAQLNGPLVIPTFDLYIQTAKFLTNAAKSSRSLRRFQTYNYGKEFANLFQIGDLHFAPYPSVEVDSLINYMNSTTRTFKTLTIFKHTNEDIAVKYILKNLNRRTLALIGIRKIEATVINYVIRQNYSTLPNTNDIVPNLPGLDIDYQMYFISGFLTLENTIDEWALTYAIRQSDPAAEKCTSPAIMAVPFPTYEFNGNPFYSQVGFLLGLALTMSTLYPVSRLVKCVVEEKETVRKCIFLYIIYRFLFDMMYFICVLSADLILKSDKHKLNMVPNISIFFNPMYSVCVK